MPTRRHALLVWTVCVACAVDLAAQNNVGINNPTPHASALLDLTSTDKGLLAPRMTTAQRLAIAAPATGLLVFDSSLGAFHFYNGSAWVQLTSGAAGWGLNGNAGTNPTVNFVGTLDLVPLSFRVGMVRAGSLGFTNTFMGWGSGGMATTGAQNSFFGINAGTATTTGASNTFMGHNAGLSSTQGLRNTVVGALSGQLFTTAADNTFIGFQSGAVNLASSNTFVGSGAGAANTGGAENTFVGTGAGSMNLLGFNNTFLGSGAGRNTLNGVNNTMIGRSAGFANTSGAANTFVGASAGAANLSGNNNTVVGSGAFMVNTMGANNAVFGSGAGAANTGSSNTFLGSQAGGSNLGAANNVFVGHQGGQGNTTGTNNTFVGAQAGRFNSTGDQNTNLGTNAGINNNGSQNVLVGYNAAASMATGTQNTYVGWNSGASSNGSQNTLLGYNVAAAMTSGVSNTLLGYQAGWGVTSGGGNTTVGFGSGYNIGAGTNNTFVGNGAGSSAVGLTNASALGYSAQVTTSNSLVLGGVGGNAVNVGIGNTAPSSRLHITAGAAGYAPHPGSALTVESGGNVYANVISGGGESGVLFGSNGNATNGGVLYNSGFTPNGMQFRTGGNTSRIGITAGGEVTVADNATWPGYKLGVIANQPSAMAALQNQHAAGYSGFHFINNSGTARAHIGAGNSSSPNWVNMGYAGTYTPHPFVLTTNDLERMRIDAAGNVGIGTTTPAAMLEVNGFTKLGSNAPAVKMIKFMGTTASTQGGVAAIVHGLSAQKILAVDVLVETTPGVFIPDAYLHSTGEQFTFMVDAASIRVLNSLTNSALILGKPFKILVTYEP